MNLRKYDRIHRLSEITDETQKRTTASARLLQPTVSSFNRSQNQRKSNRDTLNPERIPSLDKNKRNSSLSKTKGIRSYKRTCKNQSPKLGLADNYQFRKYLSNTTNVFYEERKEAKMLELIQALRPITISIFSFLLLLWFLLSRINGFSGHCPLYATCGVYINCDPGYQLHNGKCIISEQTRNNAENICLSIIDKLEREYGNNQCTDNFDPNKEEVPYISVSQVYSAFKTLDSNPLSYEIYQWLYRSENQKDHKFKLQNSKIYPLNKTKSLHCWIQTKVRQPYFKLEISCILLFLLLTYTLTKIIMDKNKAKKVYQFLKAQVESKGDVAIVQEDLERKFGKINQRIWQKVDSLRFQERKIMYYEDLDNIHWVK